MLTGGHRHTANGKILVQLVKGSGKPSSSGRYHAGSHLHGLVKGSAEEQTVQEGNQRSVGGSVVNGASYYQSVACLELGRDFIDTVVKYALAFLGAGTTCDAAPHRLVSHLHNLTFHTFLEENLLMMLLKPNLEDKEKKTAKRSAAEDNKASIK